MKNYYHLLFAAAAITATACSDDVSESLEVTPVDQKEKISFTMSDAAGAMSSGGAMTRAGFTNATQIVARFESVKTSSINGDLPTSITDDNMRSTRTVLSADDHSEHSSLYSVVSCSGLYQRYWDDAFGRYGNISVYAVAVPQKINIHNPSSSSADNTSLENLVDYGGSNVSDSNTTWKKGDGASNNNIVWEVTKGAYTASTSVSGQTATTIDNEDLCYSNNIQSGGKNGVYRWNYDTSDGKTEGYPAFSYTPTETDEFPNFIDGYLRFALPPGSDATAPGHFDKGHLIFKHALTRLTINLKRGEGFSTGSDYFKFDKVGSDDSNVKIINVPVKNTLNIKTGAWSTTSTDIASGNIEKISPLTSIKSGFDHSLMSQFIPGYTFNSTGTDASKNVLEFSIDGNTYYVTQAMIWKALNDNAGTGTNDDGTKQNGLEKTATSYTMEQGKNYILDITVKKTGIQNVTATLIGWGEVQAANVDATNAYISISSQTMGPQTTKCDHFDLYRLDAGVTDIYTNQNGVTIPNKTNWGGNYTDVAKTSDNSLKKASDYSTTGKWQTTWFWDSNRSFYHFRTVDAGTSLQATGTDADDYFNIYSGPVNDTWTAGTTTVSADVNDKNYNDYHWGAPMKTGASLTYNVTSGTNEGYSQSLYQAIGSTTDQVNIIEQHMMSTVHFVIHTGTKADGTAVSSAAVSLLDASNNATRVTLTQFAGTGQVKMGNGFITPNTTYYISSDIPVPGVDPTYGTGDNKYKLTSLTASSETYFKTANKETKSYDYRVVPQALYHGTGTASSDETLANFVGLTIVTPDNNQYYVIKKLYGVEGTITNNGSKNEHSADATTHKAAITRWYPGYEYTYHIYINKTGIENITCTVVDWVKVEGTVGDISLEN